MGAFIDLTGQQFGRLKVLGYAGASKWLCECQCENKTIKKIHRNSLMKGLTQSCGCLRKEVNSVIKLEDLSGQRFGDWLVLSYYGDSMWLCECQCEQRTRRLVKAQSLKSGVSTSCGHNTTGFQDLTGQTVKGWYIEKYLGNQEYLCRGEQGEERVFSSHYIKTGQIATYGGRPISNKIINIKGQKFGHLEVLDYVKGNKWKCKCDCGNICYKYSHNLRRSDTISCGCMDDKPLEKEYILSKIKSYVDETGELPYRYDLQKLIDRGSTTVERYIQRYDLYKLINTDNRSRQEREICELFPDGLTINRRDIIQGYELDIYYPEHKLAIEFNGSYWHSEIYKEKEYHQKKSIACAQKGIRLIHIYEYEWDNEETKAKIIKLISKALNKKLDINIIYARNTIIKEIDTNNEKEFLNKYHLQGYSNSSVKLGCYYNNEMIGLMTFGKPRFNNKYDWELVRLCWKDDVKVVGGSEKLFKHFIKGWNPKNILSYCSIDKFWGNVYNKLGFRLERVSEPNYIWWESVENKVLSRYQTQKHKLLEQGLGTEEQTENEIMDSLGYVKIHDAGNLVMVWNA